MKRRSIQHRSYTTRRPQVGGHSASLQHCSSLALTFPLLCVPFALTSSRQKIFHLKNEGNSIYPAPGIYGKDWVLTIIWERALSKSNTQHKKAQKVPDSSKEWPLVREFQGMFLLLSPHNQLGDLHPGPGHLPGQAFRTALWRMVCDY